MKKFIVLLSLILLIAAFAPINEDVLTKLVQELEGFYKKNPQEKIFVHLNKTNYFSGERVWYKIYLLEGSSHRVSSLSKIIHFELIGNEGGLIKKHKLMAREGQAEGDFEIPKSLAGGIYQVRCYTNWMRNFDAGFYFTSEIRINNTADQHEWIKPENTKKNLSFYPEGGSMVYGLTSTVVVIATGFENTEWRIRDNSGREITAVEIDSSGLGAFIIRPEVNTLGKAKTYFAENELNENLKFNLPEPEEEGYVISADMRKSDNIRLAIYSRKVGKDPEINVIVHSRGIVYYTAHGVIQNNSVLVNIPKNELPDGINEIALFDEKGDLQASRLIFINSENTRLNIATKQSKYNPRDKVSIKLKLESEVDESLISILSISIVPKSDKVENPNIKDYILLSSDIKDQKERLFKINKPNNKRLIDYIMITRNWDRISWNDVLTGSSLEKKYFVERYLIIEGYVINKQTQSGVQNYPVIISVLGKEPIFAATTTNKEGRFFFLNTDYYGDKTIAVRSPFKEADPDIEIILDEGATVSYNLDLETVQNDLQKEGIAKKQIQLAKIESIYKTNSNSPNSEQKRNAQISAQNRKLRSYLKPDFSVRPDDYYLLPDMFETIREIVPTVGILKTGDGYRLRMTHKEYDPFERANIKIAYVDEPLYMIDGFPVFDFQKVQSLDPSNISYIETIRHDNAIPFGNYAINGVMAFYTKNQDFELPTDINSTGKVEFPGYYLPRTFEISNYDSELESRLPDLRETVYWNPSVTLNDKGEASLEFYLGDNLGEMEINIQGMTKEGTPISAKNSFRVSFKGSQ